MGSKVPPKIASFKECTGCSGAACQAARDPEGTPTTGAPGGLPTRRTQRVPLPSCPTADLRFLGSLSLTLAVFRPAFLLRLGDALARGLAQGALDAGRLRGGL